MIGPFAVLNEDFQKYLVNFHIAMEAFRRKEFPPEEVMDFLYEGRMAELPKKAYEEETEHSEENLEHIINLAIKDFVRKKPQKRDVQTGDGKKEVLSFENDLNSNILYVLRRVKDMGNFCLKSIINMGTQNETGFYDHKGFRIIVESQKARHYRTHREFKNLSKEEKGKFKEKFRKKKFSQLSEQEKENFCKIFTVEYKDLTDKEKEEYKNTFQEKHRGICRDLAKKIAALERLDTIPLNPHYMKLDGLDVRVQRQVILNHYGEKIIEFEYILKRSSSRSNALFEKVLASYTDLKGTPSLLINKGDLVLNFHNYQNLENFDIEKISQTIQIKYDAARNAFSEEKNPDKRDSKIMSHVNLRMEDIPLGFIVYSETTTKNIESKYKGIQFDEDKVLETFIRDRTGDKAHTDNDYEDIKLYLCLNPEHKQISGECQIRDTIMDYKAEFGIASHSGYKERKIKGVKDEEKKLGHAFFGDSEDSWKAFFEVYVNFYTEAIKYSVDEIVNIGTIEGKKEKFEEISARIKRLYKKASERVDKNTVQNIESTIGNIHNLYMEIKGIDVILYLNSLWEINEMLRKASKELGVSFTYFDETEHKSVVHKRHIGLLYEAFEKLAMSKKVEHVATSLFVGRLITRYNDYYGKKLTADTQKSYKGMLDKFARERDWQPYKRGKREIGYIPSEVKKRGKIDKAIDNREAIRKVLHYDRIVNFDEGTIANVLRVYDKCVKT